MQADLATARPSLTRLPLADQAFIQELVNTAGWPRFIGDRHVHSSAETLYKVRQGISR